MSINGQRIDPARYSLIPRTLSFLVRDKQVLLLRLGEDRAGWSGLYNGIGGHVEQGEDALSAAIREVEEEIGLRLPEQRLCGVVTIDTGDNPGIALYVFVSELSVDALPAKGTEKPEWIPIERLDEYATVEDLPIILPEALRAFGDRSIFYASYSYSRNRDLHISLNA
jgi:8-oxo-dGTP diphosphatase